MGIILPAYYECYKLASSVNLYRFTHFLDFPTGSIFVNCLLGEHPQSPLNATSGVGCVFILNTFTYWLIRNLYRSSISRKRKMKMWSKLTLIVFVMRNNPLPDKLSGNLVGNSPTSTESTNGQIQLYLKWGWRTSCQLGTKLKALETKNENHFYIICVEVEGMGFMLVDKLATRHRRYFQEINFVPSWDEVVSEHCHFCYLWANCPQDFPTIC